MFEVVIGSTRIADAKFSHHGKTDAIGERPFLVFILPKHRSTGVKAVRADPLYAQGFAAFNGVQEVRSRGVAVTYQQECNRFIDDLFCREEAAPLADQLLLNPNSLLVMMVGNVPQHEETGTVHEDINPGHR